MLKIAKAKPRALTPKQEAFSVFYFQLKNATQAAIRAGYSPLFARENAPKLLQNTTIRERIAECEAKVASDAIGTVIERKQRLTEIYRANLTDFVTDKGMVKLSKDIPHHAAVSEYSVKTIGDGEDGMVLHRTLKLRDPVGAIAEHNKMDKVYTEQPAGSVTNNTQINIYVNSERTKELLMRVKDRTGKLIEG